MLKVVDFLACTGGLLLPEDALALGANAVLNQLFPGADGMLLFLKYPCGQCRLSTGSRVARLIK